MIIKSAKFNNFKKPVVFQLISKKSPISIGFKNDKPKIDDK